MVSLRPQAGDTAPEMNMMDSEGNTFNLVGRKRNSLVVFYRGHW